MKTFKLGAIACAAMMTFGSATAIAANDTRGEDNQLSRSSNVVVNDAAITAKVKSKLLADDTVGGLSIDVDTFEGEVMLSGDVENPAEAKRAEELAKSVDGVSGVKNKLTLEGESVEAE